MGEVPETEKPARERLEVWRATMVGTFTKGIAVLGTPVAIWAAVGAVQFRHWSSLVTVLGFAVSSIAWRPTSHEGRRRVHVHPRAARGAAGARAPAAAGADAAPEARILICSAYAHEPRLRELVRSGRYAALPKPVSPTELRDAVGRALAMPSASSEAMPSQPSA